MAERAEHPMKASSPIAETDECGRKKTEQSEEQNAKALSEIERTEGGMQTDVMEEHDEKASSPTRVADSGRTTEKGESERRGDAEASIAQPRKAPFSMDASPGGRKTDVRDEHPAKANAPIEVRADGPDASSETRLSAPHSAKVARRTAVRAGGRETDWRELQPKKAYSPRKASEEGREMK